MKRAVFHSAARQELDAAVAYYESAKKGLGLDLLVAVESAVAHIRAAPEAGSRYRTTEFRYRVVRRFPFVVYYVELDEVLWIAAVAHGRRRPGYWRRRRPD